MPKGGNVLHSLEELKKMTLVSPLELPEIDLLAADDLEERAVKIREGATKVYSWVKSTLLKIDQVAKMSREARELVAASEIAKAQKKLQELFAHEVPAYRRAAWLSSLQYEFARELNDRKEVENLLDQLVKEERLIEASVGPIKAYGKSYAISPNSLFEDPEEREIRRSLFSLLQRVYQKVGKVRIDKAEGLRRLATIDDQELRIGKPGKCTLEVSAENVSRNGQKFWRGGGTLLVTSDGKKILPLNAVGAIEEVVREMRDLDIHLLVNSLNWKVPPFVKGLPMEQAKKVQLLWHLIRRGITTAEGKREIRAQEESLQGQTTITPKEFFLEKKPGACFVEFKGVWKIPTPDGRTAEEIPQLFLLVERIENEIEISKVPQHLEDFFASCMGKKFPEGSKFEGCSQPLRAVLQAVYGQVFDAFKNAEKAVQIANGK